MLTVPRELTGTIQQGVPVVPKGHRDHCARVMEPVREKPFAQIGYVELKEKAQQSLAVLDMVDFAPNRFRFVVGEKEVLLFTIQHISCYAKKKYHAHRRAQKLKFIILRLKKITLSTSRIHS